MNEIDTFRNERPVVAALADSDIDELWQRITDAAQTSPLLGDVPVGFSTEATLVAADHRNAAPYFHPRTRTVLRTGWYRNHRQRDRWAAPLRKMARPIGGDAAWNASGRLFSLRLGLLLLAGHRYIADGVRRITDGLASRRDDDLLIGGGAHTWLKRRYAQVNRLSLGIRNLDEE